MVDRIPSRNTSSNSQANQSANQPATPPPADPKVTDQAAADFAALVGADDQQSTANTKQSNDASNASAFESEQAAPDQRVEERSRNGEQSRGDDSERHSDSDRSEKKSGDDSSGEGGGDGDAEQPMSLGDTILRSLGRAADASPAQGVSAAREPNLEGIVQQIADKILVSDPKGGQREVRIVLKDSVLPGTEIRLTEHAGKLQVKLVTDSQKSLDLLNQNHQSLQQRLTEKLAKHDVLVQVEMEGQGQPDPDGRSRQQQELTEEDEDS